MIIRDNVTDQGGGGVMSEGRPLTVTNSIVRDNSVTTSQGGGIAVIGGFGESKGSLILSGSTITGNQGKLAGGGLHVEGLAEATVINSTIVGNSASLRGAGVTAFKSPSVIRLVNVTVSGNTGPGGAILADTGGAVSIKASVIANHNRNCQIFDSGTITNDGFNVDSGTSCGFGSANGSASSTNPLLAALGDYGGATQTFALLPGSPAIDRVPTAECATITTDQRGVARPQPTGGACDAGAFESRGFTMTLVNGNNQSTPINTAFANPLRVELAANDTGVPVQGGRVTFTGPASGPGIQNSPLGDNINASGRAAVTPTANGTAGGPYTVTASAAGVATGVNFSLTNLAVPTTLVADDATGVYTGTVTLRAALTATSGGAGIGGKTIVFTLNGTQVCGGGGQPACPTTDGSGIAQLANVSLAGIDAGGYPTGVAAAFAGDAAHVATNDTAALTVNKAATALTQVQGEVTYGETTGGVTATLRRTNGDGGPMVGATVQFTLNGAPVGSATTNAQGVAALTGLTFPAGLNAGNYANAVGASFAGDGNHLAASANGPLRVARRILWVKPIDREVGLRQPNPPTTPPANCLASATATTACWLQLTNGSFFVNGDDWADLNLANLRFAYSRTGTGPANEKVGATYRITALGALSANYDIRYQTGILRVVP